MAKNQRDAQKILRMVFTSSESKIFCRFCMVRVVCTQTSVAVAQIWCLVSIAKLKVGLTVQGAVAKEYGQSLSLHVGYFMVAAAKTCTEPDLRLGLAILLDLDLTGV